MANGHGGARPGSGRKPGQVGASGVRRGVAMEVFRELHSDGVTPLHIFGRMMQGDESVTEPQFEAAKAAAPYMHPRLTAITMDARVRKSITDFSDDELYALAGLDNSEGEDGDTEA